VKTRLKTIAFKCCQLVPLHFGCEFFISYGMTECCGKISMSMLSPEIRAKPPGAQLAAMCTSGRPFSLMDVKVGLYTLNAVDPELEMRLVSTLAPIT
jgi:hypothetical protein